MRPAGCLMSPHHFADAPPVLGIRRVTTARGHRLPISHTFSIFDRPIRAENAKYVTLVVLRLCGWLALWFYNDLWCGKVLSH